MQSIKHGEKLKWIFQEPSEASAKNRSDRSLSGAMQEPCFWQGGENKPRTQLYS